MQVTPSLVVAVVVSLFGTLLPLVGLAAAAVWVYDNARERGSDAPHWLAAGTVLVPPIFPGYLVLLALGRVGERSSPPGRRERVAGTLGFGCLLAFFGGAVVAPPDPTTGTLYALVGLVPALAVVRLLFGWRARHA